MRIRHLVLILASLLGMTSPLHAQRADSGSEAYCEYLLNPTSPREIEHRVLDALADDSVSLHRLNYAIIGSNDAKLQFGFKFRLSKNIPLYFAYSNLALWDIYETSSPLDDINFVPELFYRFKGNHAWLISVDAGYIHTSNGKDDDLSRSQDRLALRINKAFTPGPLHLIWVTSIYAPLTTGKHNKDIDHYLGDWDIQLILRGLLGSDNENLDLIFATHAGRNNIPFNRGNLTAGLKYHLPTEAFHPYLYAEYFYGYGETLLNYDKRDNQFRAGFAFYY